MSDYTKVNLDEIENQAAKHGMGEVMDARFPREELGLAEVAMLNMRLQPGKRQPFAHKHNQAEELHVVTRGSGRAKLDDEIVEVRQGDLLRLGPSVTRAFEAGPDGLEFIVVSPRYEGDAEMVQDFWTEED